MTRKERIQMAIQRKKDELDHLPYQIDLTWRMRRKVSEVTGVAEEELPFFLGNHIFLRGHPPESA